MHCETVLEDFPGKTFIKSTKITSINLKKVKIIEHNKTDNYFYIINNKKKLYQLIEIYPVNGKLYTFQLQFIQNE